MDDVLLLLEPIQRAFDGLSWADLIVFAGNVVLEDASGQTFKFCPGRSDATDGEGSQFLAPRKFDSAELTFREQCTLWGLSMREVIALSARLRSGARMKLLGHYGTYTDHMDTLSNAYFNILLNHTWYEKEPGTYEARDGLNLLYMLSEDIVLLQDPYKAIVEEFAFDNKVFLSEFNAAWAKFMNADRSDGPTGNVC